MRYKKELQNMMTDVRNNKKKKKMKGMLLDSILKPHMAVEEYIQYLFYINATFACHGMMSMTNVRSSLG